MTSTPASKNFVPHLTPSPAENGVFAALETAFGDTLWDILRAYIREGEAASLKLQEASGCAHWREAVRQAMLLHSRAHDLDFRAVTAAMRAFADCAFNAKATSHERRNAAQLAVLEFERSQILIESRYPGLMAS
jgi:hypothetical protein